MEVREPVRCKYCGSSKHTDDNCRIAQKANLMRIGIPAEHLFDYIFEADLEEGLDDNTD